MGVGDAETVLDGEERQFKLGDEDAGGGDEVSGLVDFGGGEFEAGAGNDDDGVLSAGCVDEDGSGSGGVGGGEDVLAVDAFGPVESAGNVAEGVGAEFADEGYVGSGAGDAFTGGFATALAEGMNLIEATQFACAVAGISVTRPGTAPSMPCRQEIDASLPKNKVQK